MSSDELVWEAPAEPQPLGRFDASLEAAKARPGDWARIAVRAEGSAHGTVKRLRARLARDERWEAKLGKLPDQPRKRGIYVRYRTPEQMEAAKRSDA